MVTVLGQTAGVSTLLDMTRALLVFVQQLAHLLDREWLVFSIERLLICALVEKLPGTGILTRCDLFFGLRRITNAASGLVRIAKL